MALMTPAEYFGQPRPHRMAPASSPRGTARPIILPGGCRLYHFPALAGRRSPLNARSNEGHLSRQGNTQGDGEMGKRSR